MEISTTKWGIKSFLTNTEILQKLQKQDTIIQTKIHDQRFTFGRQQGNFTILDFGKAQKLSKCKLCSKHLLKANFIQKQSAKFLCHSCIAENDKKNFDVMEYDELVKSMTTFTDEAYKIFDKIKAKSQNLTKNKISQSICCQINKKKEKEVYHIKLFFQKLFEKLRKQQKILLQNLECKAKQCMQSLNLAFEFRESEMKNQTFRKEVHKLTTVMDQVYNYECIQKAFLYLNQSCQENLLIKKGNKICQELNQIEIKVQQKIKLTGKKLEHSFSDKIIENVKNIYSPITKKFSIQSTYWMKICQGDQNRVKQPPFQTEVEIQSQRKSSSHEEEFLLQSMNDIEKNQGFTKNQITFQEPFSLIVPNTSQEEQFTPILRKEQDSVTINTTNEQTTIINGKNSRNGPILQVQSQELTVLQRKMWQNSFQTSFAKTSKIQFEKTQIKERSRSPLTPLRNGSLSKLKKHEIPQKYLTIWQAAKQDRIINVDLTGAELGDSLILHLGSFLRKSQKIKSLKFIRNKLTDEIVFDLINCINQTNIFSINLSQNCLTQKSLDVLESMNLGNLKSITLSQNKIILRKVKDRIQKFKQRGITLTV